VDCEVGWHAVDLASGQLKQSFKRRQAVFGSTDTSAPPRRECSFLPAGPTLKNWFFEVVLLTLVLLIGVAVWQFYSLAWGETVSDGYMAGRSESAYHGTPAGRTLPK
jgi:hypothetical protein